MAVSIESIRIIPEILSPGGTVRAECRVRSDGPIRSVTAYAPQGDPIVFRHEANGLYVVEQEVPYAVPPGSYDVVIVVCDMAGATARTTIAVAVG